MRFTRGRERLLGGQHIMLNKSISCCGCRPAADTPFFKIMVPTVDTVRTRFIVSGLVRSGINTLLVGAVGVGKTMMANSVLEALPAGRTSMTINFSAQTSSVSLQEMIEGKLEKRTKVIHGRAGHVPRKLYPPKSAWLYQCLHQLLCFY